MRSFTSLIAVLLVAFGLGDNVETPEEIKEVINQEAPPINSTETSQESTENTYNDAPTNTFSAEWSNRMRDYEPMYVYMIPVKKKGAESFYETITKVPAKVRGAFLTETNKKDKIEFIILSPDNKLVYKNFTNECIFDFEATQPGDYIIKFRNPAGEGEINVTFTLNTYQNEILSSEHLSFSEKKIDALSQFINQINVLEDFVLTQERGQKKSKSNKYLFISRTPAKQ